ncbi:uncharacterized protein LOC112004420 isoform X2 [Quercus suber]|uniref:uncharacterized protein LOC112004420 isoform X2 n=1 Tax=Quercus suber TaxID=58331 RepID=UPI0032DE5807
MLESFFHSTRLRRNREDPWLKPQAEEFHGMKECEVGEAITTRYEDITNTLDQVMITEHHSWLNSKPVHIVLLNGSRHSSRAAFVVYEIICNG